LPRDTLVFAKNPGRKNSPARPGCRW
jgi:hypothetical protein